MPSPGLASVDDFYRHLLSAALGDGFDDGADFLGDTTLTANELAHILGRDTQFKNGGLAFDLGDGSRYRGYRRGFLPCTAKVPS